MAVFEVVLSASYLAQLVVNRWNYVSSGDIVGASKSFGLLSAMGWLLPGYGPTQFEEGTIAAQVQNSVNGSYQFRSVYVRNLYDPTDFIEYAYVLGVGGLAGGVAVAPFIAYGLMSTRVRTDIKRGQKRLAGVSEEAMAVGGAITGTVLSQLTFLATLMGETLSYDVGGSSVDYAPAVLSLEEYTTPGGKRAYRAWPTEAQQLAHAAVGVAWSVKDTVRSQVSRQYGSGS